MTSQDTQQAEKQPVQPKLNAKFDYTMAYKRFISRAAVTFNFAMFAVVAIIFFYAIFTFNWSIILFGVGLVIFQKLFIKRYGFINRFLIKHFHPQLYFNKFQKIYQENVPQNGVLFAHHPHGVWSLGIILSLNIADDTYSKMVQLGSRFILNFPYVGGFLRLWGVQSVHAGNMNRLMANRTNIGLVPGGYQQATITSHTKFRIYIKRRKGFIKMALKTGYKICPVLVMNQHKMYWTSDIGLKFRLLLNKLKLPAALFWGRFGWLPDYNLDIITVIGKPIEMPTIQKPSVQEVKKWHKHYIQTVTTLYQKYKHLNGNCPLQIH